MKNRVSPESNAVTHGNNHHFFLNLLRLAKALLSGLFIRKVTPGKAYPEVSVVRHTATTTIATPEITSMKLYPPGRRLQHDHYQTLPAKGMVMPSVFYDPRQGLVLDRKRRAIEDDHQVPMRLHWYRWKPFLTRKVEEIEGYSFAFRSFPDHHYHLLFDHLPALYMLGQTEWAFDGRVKLLHPGPLSDTAAYFMEKLCPDRVDLCEIQPDRLYRLENYLYVSYLSQRSSGCLPDFYLDHFRALFSPSRPRQKDQRIFISRAASAKRSIVNEDELFSVLSGYGFKRYRLEGMRIEEQISLFYDAQMVVAPHGAGLSNLVFSSGASVLELFPGPLVRPHYYYLCKSLNHEYRYLCSHRKTGYLRDRWIDFEEEFIGSHQNYSVDCAAVVEQVEKLLP